MARLPAAVGMSTAEAGAAGLPLAVAGGPQRIVPLVLGYEVISEAVSVAGAPSFRHLLEPVTAVAVVFEEGWVLIDGGFDPRRIHDAQLRRTSFDYVNYAPVVPSADPLRDQVAAAGLRWEELAAAVLTHAHFDHTGAARMLGADQPLLLQRREWEHATTVSDERMAFVFREDLMRAGLRVGLLDGDTELADGFRALDTSGHTPGHQSFVVELPERTVVIAGDAADLRVNITDRIPCGSTVGADGPARAQRAIDRLADLDARSGTEVWPAHDPEWGPWRAVIDAQP